jgi:cell division protein FtsZ
VCMKGASGLLVSITGGNDLTLYEVDEAASRVRAEADPDANIIVGATFDDELDGSIRVSVVATGIGLAAARAAAQMAEAPRPVVAQDRSRLTERLAGLAALPTGSPIDLDEPSLVLGQADVVGDAPVWRAPGNVTIEKRPAQLGGIGLPLGVAPKQAPPAPAKPFQPAPPTGVRRPVRRMPSVEELPVVAQNAIKAKAAGATPPIGLAAQKKKIGFLERLANVGRSRKEADAEMSAKREPEFGQGYGSLAPETPKPLAPRAEGQAPFGQKGIRIDRPRVETAVAVAPKRIEAQARPLAVEIAEPAGESLGEDDLEIPAFLRRRAH